MEKKPVSYRLSEVAKQLLPKLAELMGVNQTAVLELLIREKAKQEGVKAK